MALQINREELAWAAGFFDGEGCFGIDKRFSAPYVRVSQKDRRALDRFVEVTGLGRVYFRNGNGKYRGDTHIHWIAISGFEQTQALGAMLWQWLSPVKRDQFKKMLATFHDDKMVSRRYRKRLYVASD